MEYHGLFLSDWEGLREMEEKVTVATAERLVKKQRETAQPTQNKFNEGYVTALLND